MPPLVTIGLHLSPELSIPPRFVIRAERRAATAAAAHNSIIIFTIIFFVAAAAAAASISRGVCLGLVVWLPAPVDHFLAPERHLQLRELAFRVIHYHLYFALISYA